MENKIHILNTKGAKVSPTILMHQLLEMADDIEAMSIMYKDKGGNYHWISSSIAVQDCVMMSKIQEIQLNDIIRRNKS